MFNFKNYTRKKLELSSLTALTLLLSPCAVFAMDPPQIQPEATQPVSQGSLLKLDEVKWLIVKAKAGDHEAQDKCMDLFYNGFFQKQLTPEALDFYSWKNIEECCYANDIYAYFALQASEKIEEKFPQLVQKIKERADQGIASAQNLFGIMCFQGKVVEQNDALAAHYYKLSANQGFAPAQTNLASRYRDGKGVENSEELAVKYYQLAADQGVAAAQYNLATRYKDGRGVEKNEKLAFKYYQLAADQGHSIAQHALACLYLDNNNYLKPDPKKAFYYCQLSADQDCSPAQCSLADLYRHGIGVEKNAELAFKYFKLGADQKDAFGQYSLGCIYREGNGYIKKDDALALHYLLLAADQGHVLAQKTVFLMYAKGGSSFDKSDELSYKYCKAAADQGNAEAQFSLGTMYLTGASYLQQDFDKALEYMQLAAKQNFSFAQEVLGFTYLKGTSAVQKDNEKARHYLELAANQGQHFAQRQLASMYTHLFNNPLMAIKFAYKAIINPKTNENDRTNLLKTLLPHYVTFKKDNQEDQVHIQIEEIDKDKFFVKHNFSQKLEYLANDIPVQCTVYLGHYMNDPSFQIVHDCYDLLAEFSVNMDNWADTILDHVKRPGFCITCIQPVDDLKKWLYFNTIEVQERGMRGFKGEEEGFCFFDFKGITYSSIGAGNPQLGVKIKDYVEFKDIAFIALNKLRTLANSNLEKIVQDINVNNPTASVLKFVTLKEEINFLNHTEVVLKSICDPLEEELVRTLPLRNRATREKDKEFFGGEAQ